MMTLLLVLQLLNHMITPGVTRGLTRDQICTIKWGTDHRHVTAAMHHQVLANYGLTDAKCCEIDHLIPRELGGADDVKNLWPQPWPDAHKKDQEEDRLHKAVCAGTVTLVDAQERMRAWK